MERMGVAAQLYTVREYMKTPEDIAKGLQRIREMGYRAVQVSGIGPIEPRELKRLLDAEGLIMCNTHTSPDRLWNDLPAVIEEHRLWECKHVAIGSMPREYRGEGAEGYRRFAREASEVGRRLAEAGLTFSYHNHSFEFEKYDGRTGLDILFSESDPRYLLAEIDTYWVQHGGGDPMAWIRRFRGRMPVVHFKDMVILNGAQAFAEIGEGNLNWPAILEACHDAQVEWAAVEQDVCQRDPFESLAISYRNLRQMGLR
ncbi:MAG: sugar phosphate isomerase/epimerase [Anaerolineae bacterium]|nr:sugar phosphate isomerase/epimerase [Anaerolineae bacterium]